MDCSLALVQYLREAGPDKVHNMDSLLLHESMDVIGARSCMHAFTCLAGCMHNLDAAPCHAPHCVDTLTWWGAPCAQGVLGSRRR